MTQPDAFSAPAHDSPHATRSSSLWVAGVIVLGVVFLPALLAGLVSLLFH